MGFWTPRLEDDYIWYSAPTGRDANGDRSFATAVKVQCRIVPKVEKKSKFNGESFISTSILMTDTELIIDGKVWESTEAPSTSTDFRSVQMVTKARQMSDPTQIQYVSWL